MGYLSHYNLSEFINKYDLKVFVETGIGNGDGIIEAQKHSFTRIISIEIMPLQVQRMREKFKDDKRVEIIEGDTLVELPKLLISIKENICFWIDAHYPGADIGMGKHNDPDIDDDTRLPLEIELKAIKKLRHNNDVILFDDLIIYENQGRSCRRKELKSRKPFSSDHFYKEIFAKTHRFKASYEETGYATLTPRKMKNYRITYGEFLNVSYWNKTKPTNLQAEASINFRKLPDIHYPKIEQFYTKAKELGIEYAWHFYEPYVELTWLSDNEEASEKLITFTSALNADGKVKVYRPSDGVFSDWYCMNEREREFGAKRHALCAEWIKLYNEYKTDVDAGKGLEAQVGRTIHTLCNPLGLNYEDEAKICFARGVACTLFRFLPFKTATFIYTKILRFKY